MASELDFANSGRVPLEVSRPPRWRWSEPNLRWLQPAVQRTSANTEAADEALAMLRANDSTTSLEHALP